LRARVSGRLTVTDPPKNFSGNLGISYQSFPQLYSLYTMQSFSNRIDQCDTTQHGAVPADKVYKGADGITRRSTTR